MKQAKILCGIGIGYKGSLLNFKGAKVRKRKREREREREEGGREREIERERIGPDIPPLYDGVSDESPEARQQLRKPSAAQKGHITLFRGRPLGHHYPLRFQAC